jgi:hypothetical protein
VSSGKRKARWVVTAAVLLISALGGMYFAATLAPERLRREVERQVEQATGAPCQVASLRVSPGLPVEVEGRRLSLWNGALTVERASARVSLASALWGRVHLSLLEIDGATLAIRGGRKPSSARSEASRQARSEAKPSEDQTGGPSEDRAGWELGSGDLADAIRDWAGAVLGAAVLADTLRVRNGRVEVYGQRGEDPLRFALEDIHGQIAHSHLRGDSSLVAQSRIRAAGVYRGFIEWEGWRGASDDELRVNVSATELDLAWLASGAAPGAGRPRGWLSGVADYEATGPGTGELALDAVARDFAWAVADEKPVLAAPRIAARARAALRPTGLAVHGARIEIGPLDVSVAAALARPFGLASGLRLRVGLAGASVDELRELLTAMPAFWVDDAREVLEALGGGRVVQATAHVEGPLRDWTRAADPERAGLPRGLALAARLEDLRIQLDDDDAIERVSFQASWKGDRLELHDVRGEREGRALPRLDLELDGVSHLLASDLDDRVPASDDVLLPGLPLLLSLFEPEPESDFVPPHVEVRLQRLEHPALLWPMESVEVGFDGRGGVLVGEIRRATWAGVPLRGVLAWSGAPMHLAVRLTAGGAPPARAALPPPSAPERRHELEGAVWATGDFEIGPLHSDVWAHERMRGDFRAAKSQVAFASVAAVLAPAGRVEGDGGIDLGRADAMPYRARFAAQGLDADALFEQADLGDDRVTGRVDLRGELRGRHERGVHPFAALSGRVAIAAYDGQVRHDLPVVLALTLAGEGLNFASGREFVRYQRCEAALALTDGVASTDALAFEGPDVRIFASGALDLGHPPHDIDAEVVVFLFRPVDRMLGAVPVLGSLILGGSENLFAAYFRLGGPWDAPTASSRPLRTLNAGPMRLVTGLPSIVRRGIQALGGARAEPGGDGSAPPPGDGAQP